MFILARTDFISVEVIHPENALWLLSRNDRVLCVFYTMSIHTIQQAINFGVQWAVVFLSCGFNRY